MKPVNFECPDGESITAIQSWHSDWHDDRQWAFGCSKVPEPATLSNCKWTVHVVTEREASHTGLSPGQNGYTNGDTDGMTN
ncbi:hypothetical protein BaRGS_00040064, partial [Batillaria attramentaria]